jgi:putative glycosyltransferase (TIGR04372 family)
LSGESRYLTFKEILNSDIGSFSAIESYTAAGIEVVENTSSEIAGLACEMNDRLDGVWESAEEDEELQREFWSIYRNLGPNEPIPSRVGSEFLRNNKDLLR